MAANVWDTGRWALEDVARVDFMTEYCFRTLAKHVDVAGKSILELGAGTGRLSYLCLHHGAASATLVDSSRRAVELARGLFHGDPRARIVEADLLSYTPDAPHDIVLSSGLIEHFRGPERAEVIRRHVAAARECAAILHPADSLYFRLFAALPLAKKWYGYQEAFSLAELRAAAAAAGARLAVHERFYLFMTIPLLHNARINAKPWAEALARRWGFFELSVLRPR